MAGCLPCFIIPLLLFIFHRYIQPIILKFWNPWGEKVETPKGPFECYECKKGDKNCGKDEQEAAESNTLDNTEKLKIN